MLKAVLAYLGLQQSEIGRAKRLIRACVVSGAIEMPLALLVSR